MSTETKTRPPVWVRKFKAWAAGQQPDDDGLIMLGRDLRKNLGPWTNELPRKEQVRVSLAYDPARETFEVVIEGRNHGDTEPVETPRGIYQADTWPYRMLHVYTLDKLPPGAKLVINRHGPLGGFTGRR